MKLPPAAPFFNVYISYLSTLSEGDEGKEQWKARSHKLKAGLTTCLSVSVRDH